MGGPTAEGARPVTARRSGRPSVTAGDTRAGGRPPPVVHRSRRRPPPDRPVLLLSVVVLTRFGDGDAVPTATSAVEVVAGEVPKPGPPAGSGSVHRSRGGPPARARRGDRLLRAVADLGAAADRRPGCGGPRRARPGGRVRAAAPGRLPLSTSQITCPFAAMRRRHANDPRVTRERGCGVWVSGGGGGLGRLGGEFFAGGPGLEVPRLVVAGAVGPGSSEHAHPAGAESAQCAVMGLLAGSGVVVGGGRVGVAGRSRAQAATRCRRSVPTCGRRR